MRKEGRNKTHTLKAETAGVCRCLRHRGGTAKGKLFKYSRAGVGVGNPGVTQHGVGKTRSIIIMRHQCQSIHSQG